MRCETCGTKENLQKHHIRYGDPAGKTTLCIDCHKKQHNHGVGLARKKRGKNLSPLTGHEAEFKRLWHEGKKYSELKALFGVSDKTLTNWRHKLSLMSERRARKKIERREGPFLFYFTIE